MIQDMKKLTFLVTNGEYDQFISDIRELGVIHVEELQQGATSDELQAALDLAERYKEAIKALDFAENYGKKSIEQVDRAEECRSRENHSVW